MQAASAVASVSTRLRWNAGISMRRWAAWVRPFMLATPDSSRVAAVPGGILIGALLLLMSKL